MRFWNAGGFFSSVKGHVIKWWQLVILPILHINNNEKNTQYTIQSQPMQEVTSVVRQSIQTTPSAMQEGDTGFGNSEEDNSISASHEMSTEDPMEVLRRINEEKEAARRKEIDAAKKKASEEARIAAIMNANKVDVNAFIEAGKAAKEEIAAKREDELKRREAAEKKALEVQQANTVKATVDMELKKRKQEEDMQRAQEIMDRLNREAAEDEAKKQAEIELAKQEAKKQFG